MGEVLFPCWDPVLLNLPGPLDLRWYGLMYIVGFLIGHHILVRLCRSKFLPIKEEKVGDLILWLVIGVMVGGRLGYSIFYSPEIWKTPLEVFALWKGGLSFHGGLLGVLVVTIWFARKNKVPFPRMADGMALSVTPGIFAVRMANFINGELWGRVTDDSVPWAMRFPTDPVAVNLMGIRGSGISDRDEQIQAAIAEGKWDAIRDQVDERSLLGLVVPLGVAEREFGMPSDQLNAIELSGFEGPAVFEQPQDSDLFVATANGNGRDRPAFNSYTPQRIVECTFRDDFDTADRIDVNRLFVYQNFSEGAGLAL